MEKFAIPTVSIVKKKPDIPRNIQRKYVFQMKISFTNVKVLIVGIYLLFPKPFIIKRWWSFLFSTKRHNFV